MFYRMTVRNADSYSEVTLTYKEWDDVRNVEDILRMSAEDLTITVRKVKEQTGLGLQAEGGEAKA